MGIVVYWNPAAGESYRTGPQLPIGEIRVGGVHVHNNHDHVHDEGSRHVAKVRIGRSISNFIGLGKTHELPEGHAFDFETNGVKYVGQHLQTNDAESMYPGRPENQAIRGERQILT